MVRSLALVALALAAAGASAMTPEEVAHETVAAYRFGKTAQVLKLERDCWGSVTRATVRLCTQRMLAGGLLDVVMQRVERRGPIESQLPQVQRQRFEAGVRRAGLSPVEGEALKEAAARDDVPAIVRGLTEAGL